jgi:hypothetical protein
LYSRKKTGILESPEAKSNERHATTLKEQKALKLLFSSCGTEDKFLKVITP